MKYKLSPSSIGLFLDCPRCFWLQMNRKIRRPSGAFPSLPSGMDAVLKKHFDRHRNDNTPPEELEGRFSGHLFRDAEKLSEWRNNFRGLRHTDERTGSVLMGALDDLFVTSDGKYAPLDFKTRGFPRKDDTHSYYQHQMDIYSFLLKKNGMEPAGFAILIFYHPESVNENHDVVFDPDPVRVRTDPERGARLFSDALKCLGGGLPEPAKDCGFCRYCQKKGLESFLKPI